MIDIQSATAEIRRGKKKEERRRKKETTGHKIFYRAAIIKLDCNLWSLQLTIY